MVRRAAVWGILLCLLLGLSNSVPRAADAGIVDSLFQKLRPILLQAGVKPDELEMAAFTISRPSEATTVYSRAAAQDYPFFALVGAAKAAKDKSLPKIGVFTYAKCIAPITAVDTVFSTASTHVTNQKAKADTNAVMQFAAGYAADYANAQAESAREQAKQQLAESIPYFGDIETICRFAFETDFQLENDLFAVATAKARLARDIYAALKEGDVITGVKLLTTLNISRDQACGFIDNAVFGGLIGRTPLLGQLAKGACAGFLGSVIDGFTGIIDGGVGVIENSVTAAYQGGKKIACTVYGYFGSGCSKAKAPPPPTAVQVAKAVAQQYCSALGGLYGVSFPGGIAETDLQQQTRFEFTCKDLSFCSKRPDGPYQCSTGAERAAWAAQQAALLDAEFKTKLPIWGKEFEARWKPKCADPTCAGAIEFIRANAQQESRQTIMFDSAPSYAALSAPAFERAEENAALAVEDSLWRRPKIWAASFQSYWSKDCPNAACTNAIRTIADNAVIAVAAKRKSNPKAIYEQAATPIYADAVAKARLVRVDRIRRLQGLTPGAVPQPAKLPPAGSAFPATKPNASPNPIPLTVPGALGESGGRPVPRTLPTPTPPPARAPGALRVMPRVTPTPTPTPTPVPR